MGWFVRDNSACDMPLVRDKSSGARPKADKTKSDEGPDGRASWPNKRPITRRF